MTSHQVESNANTALGKLLQPMLGRAVARAQHSSVIVEQPLLQPDALITAPGRAPVVVEAEYLPAAKVEEEAEGRLGLEVVGGPRRIEAAIALRYPQEVADAADPERALRAARLSYCLFTVARYGPAPERKIKSIARFPESGWLDGSLADLAELIRLASVPQLAVDEAADTLEKGIGLAADILNEMESRNPAVNPRIAGLLGMENVPQTRRMAGAIIANAMVFHHRVAGIHPEIKALSQVCGPGVRLAQEDTLVAWDEILAINYWPIFAIGRQLLREIPTYEATRILEALYYIVSEVNKIDIDHARDLTGRIFQRLIADRKYLATYYTRPESAALLARLAIAKLEKVDWADPAAISRLRIADFACGTGALLSAVYDQIAARHERAGGDPEAIHSAVMEETLYGFDVMPSAVHITSATLSGAQPNVGFGQSRLYTMPYGRLDYESVAIGSLEFLTSDTQFTLSNFSDPVLRANGNGAEAAHQTIAELPAPGFDLVIMNPPFTRNTTNEGAHSGQFNAAFAAFDTSENDQRAMSRRMDALKRDTCYHGNAGIASAFAALGDRKLKPGGILALVLPLSAAAGLSWQSFRQMLAKDYDDLTVVGIAANGRDMSFSSDTGMAECLVIARKKSADAREPRNQFVSLRRRPRDLAQSRAIAQSIAAQENIRQLEDGPYGGTPLPLGEDTGGEMLAVGQLAGGKWSGVRIGDYALAQTAYALAQSRLWLPGGPRSLPLPATELGQIAAMGLHHRDITGPAPRGPFYKAAASRTATYPSLWNHQARNETRLVCAPDSQLRARRGMDEKADAVWATASRAHLNCEFTFGSQALAAAFTERETVGGSVWPNVRFADKRFDYAFALWSNSALGLLLHWWHSSRQQSSKVRMTIHSAESLPILDFRTLTEAQLDTAQEIFEEFRDKELQPAYLADADPNRALLDRRVICDLLGFDAAVYQGVRRLAEKWCAEPSVHGGKARPGDSRLVV